MRNPASTLPFPQLHRWGFKEYLNVLLQPLSLEQHARCSAVQNGFLDSIETEAST